MIEVIGEPFIRIESNQKRKYFPCRCSCGKLLDIRQDRIYANKSCGCESKLHNGPRKHLMSYTKEYKCWQAIKERCLNPSSNGYEYYGAIGVTMQEDWIDNFEKFYEYVGDAPSKSHSIDRIDASGNYEEGNLRWATKAEQVRNRGKFVNNTSGKTGVVKIIDKNGNIYYTAKSRRLDGSGWSKTFSESKHGESAFDKACEYRDFMLECLNKEGAGYTEDHGK